MTRQGKSSKNTFTKDRFIDDICGYWVTYEISLAINDAEGIIEMHDAIAELVKKRNEYGFEDEA